MGTGVMDSSNYYTRAFKFKSLKAQSAEPFKTVFPKNTVHRMF